MRRGFTGFLIFMLCLGFFCQGGTFSSITVGGEMKETTQDTGIQVSNPEHSPSLDVSEQMWNLTLGGSDDDLISAMSNCSDGGYIMTGTTSSYGVAQELWLVKVNQYGDVEWNQTYGMTLSSGADVIECEGGGFAIAGSTYVPGFMEQMLLFRTDANGNHLWNKTFGFPFSDIAYSLLETSTGGFLLTGIIYGGSATSHLGILLWTDSSGNHFWNETYSFGGQDTYVWLSEAIECSTGGFLVVGSFIDDYPEILVIRTNNWGSVYWYYYYGYGWAYSVIENGNGRYSLTGGTLGGTFFLDLNPDGSERRSSVHAVGTPNSVGNDIVEHPLGGYVIAGSSSYSAQNATILRLDSRGRELWNVTLEYDLLSGSEALCVFASEDHSIIVAGTRDKMGLYPNGYILSMPNFNWVDSPADAHVERDLGYSFDANTSMDLFADTWWFGNTLLEVDEDGFITTPSPLPLGDHEFTIYAMDIFSRTINGSFFLHVEDNLAPQWITPPSNQEHEYGTIFEYDVQAIDTSGVTYWISDTDNFEHLGDGYIVSSTVLSLGEYPLRVNVSDTYGNMDSAYFTVTVSDTTSPSLDSVQDIIKEFSITDSYLEWNCSDLLPDVFIITRDNAPVDSGVWNGTDLRVRLDGLGLGVYLFHLFINDTSGNIAEDEVTVTIADLITPTIDHPSDIWFLEGVVGNIITWSPDDLFPDEYIIYLNGIEVESEDWDGSSISYSVDGLAVGFHNLTVVAIDTSGNFAVDSVQIGVIEWPDGETTTTTSTTTTTTDLIEYIRGVEGALGLGLIAVGALAGLAILVGLINILMMRKMKSNL
ncbi:MAG: hypothetical protein ACFE7R_02105 [Candidatus Hodarchaeota archaeon]